MSSELVREMSFLHIVLALSLKRISSRSPRNCHFVDSRTVLQKGIRVALATFSRCLVRAFNNRTKKTQAGTGSVFLRSRWPQTSADVKKAACLDANQSPSPGYSLLTDAHLKQWARATGVLMLR